MRTLAPGLTTAVAASSTKPGYLIEVHFNPVLRLTTRETAVWNGYVWTQSAIVYSDQQLQIPNGDLAFTQLLLSQGTTDRHVVVWMFYGDEPTDDTVDQPPIFDGYMDGSPSLIDPITLPLYATAIAGLFAPRVAIRADTGFSVLPAPGSSVYWNGITIKIPAEYER